jgi:SAM-dependent methyltransferase
VSWDERFAARYDEWAAPMTADVPFFVELARETEGPLVELAVGSGRVAIPVARKTGRVVVGIDTSPSMLEQAGLPPAPQRARLDWSSFLGQHAATTLACDFFTVDTVWLKRLYVLFVISIGSRRIEYVACTSNPDGAWMIQQARNLLMDLDDRGQRARS